jgi:hypothetical protein
VAYKIARISRNLWPAADAGEGKLRLPTTGVVNSSSGTLKVLLRLTSIRHRGALILAQQPYWNHKLVNVLDALPRKKQAEAREVLQTCD